MCAFQSPADSLHRLFCHPIDANTKEIYRAFDCWRDHGVVQGVWLERSLRHLSAESAPPGDSNSTYIWPIHVWQAAGKG